jgi:hypothetical protein
MDRPSSTHLPDPGAGHHDHWTTLATGVPPTPTIGHLFDAAHLRLSLTPPSPPRPPPEHTAAPRALSQCPPPVLRPAAGGFPSPSHTTVEDQSPVSHSPPLAQNRVPRSPSCPRPPPPLTSPLVTTGKPSTTTALPLCLASPIFCRWATSPGAAGPLARPTRSHRLVLTQMQSSFHLFPLISVLINFKVQMF